MFYIEILMLIIILLFFIYKWCGGNYKALKERGIPHKKPTLPLGNMNGNIFLNRASFIHFLIQQHMDFRNSKIYGSYTFRDPAIYLRDPDLIKKIAIKDFESFPGHGNMFGELESSHIFAKSLVALTGEKWRKMHGVLTRAFTGSKLRQVFDLINECSLEAIKYLTEKLENSQEQMLDLETKEYFSKYANDVIASSAFGVKVNSFKDPNNDFYTIGKSLLEDRRKEFVKLLLYRMMPKVMKALRVEIIDGKVLNYFRSLVFGAMQYRREHNIIRPDMIHFLMQAQQQEEENNLQATASTEQYEDEQFTDEDLLAQCLLFFSAGFEVISACLAFTTHELAMNLDVQEQLYSELLTIKNELDGQPLNYNALLKMKYLDMVIFESLRKWPPGILTDRACAHDYDLKDDNGNLVAHLKAGDQIFIPIICLHHDPENFENPQKFDPERFSEENKHRIKPMTYLPFGVGSRACIGNRLALMKIKTLLYYMILKFKVVATEKTNMDIFNTLKGAKMEPKELFWLKFIPRN